MFSRVMILPFTRYALIFEELLLSKAALTLVDLLVARLYASLAAVTAMAFRSNIDCGVLRAVDEPFDGRQFGVHADDDDVVFDA